MNLCNLCNLWKKNYSVCRKCGVHFEPATGADARWGYLCATHRAPLKKYDLEHDAVMAWAKDNLPKVKKMMDEEIAEREERRKIKYESEGMFRARERQAILNQLRRQGGWP